MKSRFVYCFSLILLGLLVGCQEEEDCLLGTPVPIFSKSYAPVQKHEFTVDSSQMDNPKKGITSVERALLSDTSSYKTPVIVELYQEGCHSLYQQYNFIYDLKIPDIETIPDRLWIERAKSEFDKLSTLGPGLASSVEWTKAIFLAQERDEIKMGEFFDVQDNIKMKLDRILSTDNFIIVVTITSEELE